VTRTRDGIVFPVDTTDFIQRFLYLFGVWEPNLTAWIRSRLQPGDTFVDVGAHHGYYTTLASQIVGDSGHVVAIEPIEAFFRTLEHVLELNGCKNVRTVQQAVSERSEELSLWLGGAENLGNTSLRQDDLTRSHHRNHQIHTVAVKASSLTDLLTQDELERTRLIKMDVEGGEAAAINGIADSLDRLRPDAEIVIEVTPRIITDAGHKVDEVINPLVRAGFHVYRIPNDYDPESYPGDLRRPRLPVRWNLPIDEQMDLVFSRADQEQLA
jgi:FkbM family methyltransferase